MSDAKLQALIEQAFEDRAAIGAADDAATCATRSSGR